MKILAAVVLTVLPGTWVLYGLRFTGIPSPARLAMAIALSPSIVGLQLLALESIGVSFAISSYALVLLNLPGGFLLTRRLRAERVTGDLRSLLSFAPFLATIVAIPVAIWSLIPGLRTYEWETMLHTDVIYTIARDGVNVEEANLAGLNLAYGWIGHSYWSLIGWLGNWAPTRLYPFTNILWIIVAFVLSYQLGKVGLGLHKAAALLGVALMFLGTNLVGIFLRILTGYSQWWESYFGDMRYSPFLSKFYAFDTMLWGMTLLIAIALVYTIALQKKVTYLEGLTASLLICLGLVYPVLFPAGLIFTGCFLFLTILGLSKNLPKYTRSEIVRLGFAVLLSVLAIFLYLRWVTADRDIAIFAHSGRGDIRFKSIRFFGAMGPFIGMAALPFIGFLRRRNGPALLLALSAMGLSAVYMGVDLAKLEYKYVLAATICLAVLAAAGMNQLFRQRPRLGWVTVSIVTVGLAALNLLLVFQAGQHIPDNLEQGVPLEEDSFWLSLDPSEQDSHWTTTIRENTPENTVVIAQKPGVKLSVIVARSMYIPSDTDAGHLPGYNLNQRFYLLQQRGYPEDLYNHRLAVVEALYSSNNEIAIIAALHSLKELRRPVAIYFPSQDIYSLNWMGAQNLGRPLFFDEQHSVWLVDDPSALP